MSKVKSEMECRPGPITFCCKICLETFSSSYAFLRHMMIHTEEKDYKCPICRNTFRSNSALKEHLSVHVLNNRCTCDICGKELTSYQCLKSHLLIHTGEKQNKCPICAKLFITRSNLKMHLLTHRGEKKQKCYICKQSFSGSNQLKYHQRIHATADEDVVITCEIGRNQISQAASLKEHGLIQKGEKIHKCYICQKSYSTVDSLSTHLLLHQLPENWQCLSKDELSEVLMNLNICDMDMNTFF